MAPAALLEALSLLGSAQSLTEPQAQAAVADLLHGDSEPVIVSAFLTALHCRGIDADILAGAAAAVRSRMERFAVADELRPILDTCGTGGDGANSVNISTASAIVVAACGVRVAKHGNRSATGNSGSAEVLHELGVKYDAEPQILRACLEELGITFLFAPRFHPSLKLVAPIRKQLPFRTLFNLIGPLVNPAEPDAQVIGVPDRVRAQLLCRVLRSQEVLPADKPSNARSVPNRAYVLCGANGLDEVSLSGPTHVFPGHGVELHELIWQPTEFGLPMSVDSELTVSGPTDSAAKIRTMLSGQSGPVRDVILANAAAALKLVEKVDTLAEGVMMAAEAVDRGNANRLLDRWIKLSHS